MLGFTFRGSLKRLSLGKTQLEMGWACSLKGGKTLISSPRERLHNRCPSFPSTATGPPQGTDPYASFQTAPEATMKPLADIALLEEVLRFQGTFFFVSFFLRRRDFFFFYSFLFYFRRGSQRANSVFEALGRFPRVGRGRVGGKSRHCKAAFIHGSARWVKSDFP